MHRKDSRSLGLLLFCALTAVGVVAQNPRYVSFSAAQPILQAYQSSLPAALKPAGHPTAAAWDAWVRSEDQKVRARLERGEEDTLTNLLRLGVTYTKQERISYAYLERYGSDKYVDSLANKRADDLVRALAAPHASEGMAEMRVFLEKRGFNLKTREGQAKVKVYMLANLARMRDEVIRATKDIYEKKGANLSQQFKERGISTDSNLYPDYLIELHLRHMMAQGLLKPHSVRRVAIVGPGLDFVNKNEGSDFYPPQTTQPFAVIDTLARLGLADPATVDVETFDISSRVNEHLARARKQAEAGRWYTIQLLSSPSDKWNQDYSTGFLEYWQKLGDKVGKPAPKIPVPAAAGNIWNRAVSVQPGVVLRVVPVDMNVVYQTLPLPPDKQFDLIIGTNIFVYYGSLEQSLARANLGTMIKAGGFLISDEYLPNTAPSALVDSLQTKTVVSPWDTDIMYSYLRPK
ncbi:MAG TPA: hypothetical protein VKV05_10460 [Terriglobales bacterium]|nr:hypothetical protein [Terriglobales bacterium]